jgi:hypothetical protein
MRRGGWASRFRSATARRFQRAVLEMLNGIRSRLGLAQMSLASKQSDVASSVAPAFFAAMLDGSESAQGVVDSLTLGLMAGWDVSTGMIRAETCCSTPTRACWRWERSCSRSRRCWRRSR